MTEHDPDTGMTTVSLARGQAALAPFVAPVIRRFEPLRALLLAVRLAMTVWAFTLGAVATRSADDVVALDRAVRTLTVVGLAIAGLWFVLGAAWAVLRTRNIRRLDGRYPTTWRAARVWFYAPAWVALMSATLVRLEPHPDLDLRPSIIVVGFVTAMLPVYLLVQRLFRSLVRSRPDAPIFVLYVLDTIALGLIWWRISTWPDRAVDIDATTTDLLTSAAFAAAIALLVGLLAAVYLDLEADRAEDTRLLALRTRHDHRIARLQGLDPLESATRWALWTARLAADRALAETSVAAIQAVPPRASSAPPAPATIEPVGPVVDPIATGTLRVDEWFVQTDDRPRPAARSAAAPDDAPGLPDHPPTGHGAVPPVLPPAQPQAVPSIAPDPADTVDDETPLSTVERIRRRVAESERGTAPELSPAVPEPAAAGDAAPAVDDAERGDRPADADDVAEDVAAVHGDVETPVPLTADDALARALRRRFADADREAQRSRRRPGGPAEPLVEPVGDRGRRLAASIGAELDRGVRRDFADRVRALSQQFDPERAIAEQTRDETHPAARNPAQQTESRSRPLRLAALEVVRYLTLVLLVIGAIASGGMVVAVSRFGAPDNVVDIDGLDVARSVAVHAFIAAGICALAWMFGAAWYAARVEPTLRAWPFAVLLGCGVPTVVVIGLERGAAGPWSLGAMIVIAGLLLAGLRLLLPVFDTFAVTTWTLNAWLFDTVAVVVFVLASPLGSEIDGGVNAGRVAFGAVLVGLSLTIGAVLVSLTATEYENALRGSTELARVIESRRARSPGTRGSSRAPSGSQRSD